MAQNYKKYGYGLTIKRSVIRGKVYRLIIINDNFCDNEIYHFAVVVGNLEGDKITFERDYKTRTGAEKLYKRLLLEGT